MEETSGTLRCCSKCGKNKRGNQFYIDNVCTTCEDDKACKECQETKPNSEFRRNRRTCRECEKGYGREYRKSDYGKHKSKDWVDKNRERMSELQANWFQENKSHVREKNKERMKTDARFRFIVNQRRRISLALGKKQKKTIEYLGCNSEEFFDWISSHLDDKFTLDKCSDYHIDHVIPISQFNFDNESEVMVAFNWRNTMPLSAVENLSKNKNIIPEQVEQHFNHLKNYHREKNIELPQQFIDLFAKHLVAGIP
jgi:hypothetical protein